jgi:hypothetical protein
MPRKSETLEGLSSILVGVSGEYFVAAELSRRGYVASITLRNTKGIDIVATNADASRSVGISVKTNRGKKKDWMVNASAESYYSDTLFYVFVNLNSLQELPCFHIVSSKHVATYVLNSHRKWLAAPSKTGAPHKDSSMRRFKDPDNQFLGRWELLGL